MWLLRLLPNINKQITYPSSSQARSPLFPHLSPGFQTTQSGALLVRHARYDPRLVGFEFAGTSRCSSLGV